MLLKVNHISSPVVFHRFLQDFDLMIYSIPMLTLQKIFIDCTHIVDGARNALLISMSLSGPFSFTHSTGAPDSCIRSIHVKGMPRYAHHTLTQLMLAKIRCDQKSHFIAKYLIGREIFFSGICCLWLLSCRVVPYACAHPVQLLLLLLLTNLLLTYCYCY